METYTAPRPFEDCPRFQIGRQIALNSLDAALVVAPLTDLIDDLSRLPYLSTLQYWHGHFLTTDSNELPDCNVLGKIYKVEYRLASKAFCIENNLSGQKFAQQLKSIPPTVDRSFVQFCSAQWFWGQWENSYALQVMPQRFKDQDRVIIYYHETEKVIPAGEIFFRCMKDFTSTILEQKNGR